MAAAAFDSGVTVTWQSVADATSYTVRRNGTVLTTTAGTSITDTGLTNGSRYTYTVSAANATQTSVESSAVAATPMPPAPATPAGLVAIAGNAQVALTWTPAAYASSYSVLRNGTQVGTTAGASYTDTGLTNGTAYSYAVVATNMTGSSLPTVAVSATPRPPAPTTPTAVSATAGNAQVALTWTGCASATSYKVLRNGTQVATPTSTSFTDTGLTNGTTYSYTLVASNMTADSAASTAVTSTPKPPVPATPTGLTATAGVGQVSLGWTAPANATSYKVLRNGTQVGTPTGTSFTDTGLAYGTSYSYTVVATNLAGDSAATGAVSATTKSPAPAAPTGLTATAGSTQVSLSWTAATYATSYKVLRNGTQVGTATGTSYTDTGLTNGTTYNWTVVASNATGDSAATGAVSAMPKPPAPAAPTGLVATAGNAQVSLSWTAATYATSYKVLRNGTQVGTPTGTSYTDTGLTNGTAYSYTVVATNMTGDSAASGSASATPAAGGVPLPTGWTKVLYSDDFTGSTVDTAKWNVRNSTYQSNTSCRNFSKNVSVASGVLSIRSGTDNTVDPSTHPWTCGYLDSIGKFSTQYGYWEARLRFPWGSTAQGYWPAFWLRPDDGGIGEVDMMEAWAGTRASVHQTLWRDYTGTASVQNSNNTGFSWYDPTAWHTYAVQKEAGVMKFYIDGTMVWDATNSATWRAEAFDRTVNWNIRLNLQVGSSWGGNPSASTNLAQTYDVDYVRVLGR